MLQERLESLREVHGTPWRRAGTPAVACLGALFAGVAWIEATARPTWVPLLDSANLVFHEAGHPIFGILPGETLAILGGTFMQLAVPLMVACSFWWKRQAAGFGFALFWLFQNFHNIAAYMADARAQELPLVGGGEHDWTALFSQWGCLSRDTDIARVVSALGWLGMLAAAAWLGWRWWQGREAAAD